MVSIPLTMVSFWNSFENWEWGTECCPCYLFFWGHFQLVLIVSERSAPVLWDPAWTKKKGLLCAGCLPMEYHSPSDKIYHHLNIFQKALKIWFCLCIWGLNFDSSVCLHLTLPCGRVRFRLWIFNVANHPESPCMSLVVIYIYLINKYFNPNQHLRLCFF